MYHTIALTLVPGVGPVLARNLVQYCGSPEIVFRTSKRKLMLVPGVGAAVADALHDKSVFLRVDTELTFMDKNKIHCLTWLDPAYPNRLLHCVDAPAVLFTKGNADLNAERMLAVVGTRKPSNYGKKVCENLVEKLRETGVTIVSGLAYGIDITAHKTAMQVGLPTIAVLAHGLDRIYPYAHKQIAIEMLEQGAWVTEFMSETQPDKQNFPRRNRIVAGMIDGLVVVETGVKGGAVITALLADDYNRDVMALPGEVTHQYARGCHKLIKTNKAALIEDAGDVLDIMGWNPAKSRQRSVSQTSLFPALGPEESTVYAVLRDHAVVYIDTLQEECKLTPGTLAGILLNLEFQGLIQSLPGKCYALA